MKQSSKLKAAGQACSISKISKISTSRGAKAASARPGLMTLHHQHAAQIAENLLGAEFTQTVQMAQRTLAGKARTAFEVQPLYLCEIGEWRCVARVGRAEHGHQRAAQRGGHVHQE